MKCRKCGSDNGYYSTVYVKQYYKINGEPNGYDLDLSKETETVRCLNCGARVKLEKIREEEKHNDER